MEPIDRAGQFVRQTGMLRRTGSVLAAVSGGPDSVALLLTLERLAPELGFSLTVVHFDHMLRPDSEADLEWVRQVCVERGIPFLSGEGDVRETAQRQGMSLEAAARAMRYQFLSFVAGERGIDAIATGHTADDQAETVLMRVLRGSGVRGIRGMQPVSTVPGGAQKLVRPLLQLSRADTAAICQAAGLVPRDDPTNTDVAMLRNRVRHDVLPLLEGINPSVRASLVRLGRNATEVFERIEREAMTAQPLERGPAGAIFALGTLRPLATEALTLAIEREAAFYRLDVEVNATRLANLRAILRTGAGQTAFGQAVVEASSGRVRIGPLLEVVPFEPAILNVPGVTIAGPWRVEVSTDPFPETPGPVSASVPFESLAGALRIRPLQPGDRMAYHGIERKVADVFATERTPRWDRASSVALADRERVRAVISASGVFEADRPDEADLLYVRLSSA